MSQPILCFENYIDFDTAAISQGITSREVKLLRRIVAKRVLKCCQDHEPPATVLSRRVFPFLLRSAVLTVALGQGVI